MKIASLFAGQGAQYVGMGKALCECSRAAAETFDRAGQVLGTDIRKICFEGPAETLKQTRYCQPAILTTTVACFRALVERVPDFRPAIGAGLSLGEFSALVCAEMISFEDGLKLIERRAALMDEAAQKNPGAMACILGLTGDEVVRLIAEKTDPAWGVEAANLNSPEQTVISGPKDGVAKAVEVFPSLGAKRVIPLEVSGGFHSALMKEAAEKFAEVLEKVEIRSGKFPVVGNARALPHDLATIRPMLVRQMHSSVLWEKSVCCMRDQGCAVFVEFGCGKVLSGLNRKIDRTIASLNVEDPASLDAAAQKLAAGQG